MSPIFKSSTSTLLSPNWCLPPPSTLYPSSVSLLTDVNQNLMSDVPWRDVSRHWIKVKSELHSVSSRSRELRPTLIFIIIKLLLIKKTKKPKKRGKPHSIEIKLLTNIWCSEVNMHINNLISILQFSRLGKSGERPFLWLKFSVQQPAPTSRTSATSSLKTVFVGWWLVQTVGAARWTWRRRSSTPGPDKAGALGRII